MEYQAEPGRTPDRKGSSDSPGKRFQPPGRFASRQSISRASTSSVPLADHWLQRLAASAASMADTPVDVTDADWSNCVARGGRADVGRTAARK